MSKFQTFRSLDAATRGLTVRLILLSNLLEAGFRLLGVAATQRHLFRWAGANQLARRSPPADVLLTVRKAENALNITRRNTPAVCLSTSMALWALLSRQSILTELRVGFRRNAGRIEGHAWLEYSGKPLRAVDLDIAGEFTPCAGAARFDLWAQMRSTEGSNNFR